MPKTSKKVSVFAPRKHKLIRELARGMGPGVAASNSGLKPISAYRALRDPEIQAEIARLRQASERALLEDLQHLIRLATRTLADDMRSPNPRVRRDAIELALRLGTDNAWHEAAVRGSEPDDVIPVAAERVSDSDSAHGKGDHSQTGQGGPTPCETYAPRN